MLDEFKKFVARGNVMDMAVGIVIGAAFTAIVKSVVDNLIMPPIGFVLGGVDFSNLQIVLKQPTGPGPFASGEEMLKGGAVLIRYGLVLNAALSFFIIAVAVFLMMKAVNRLLTKPTPAKDPETKDCPRCAMAIPFKAKRCGHCTSELAEA